MRVGRPFRLYDGKQGRAEDKKRIREELTDMLCNKCNEPACTCSKNAIEIPLTPGAERLEKLEARIKKLEAENHELRERLWQLERRVDRHL